MTFATLLSVISLVIGFQLPPQTDAQSDNVSRACTLDGKAHPNGTVTTADRCLRYVCINGIWKYHKEHINCVQCQSSGKKDEDTSIKTYDVHNIGGVSKPSYQFDDSEGYYSLSQSGLGTSPPFGVKVNFNYTETAESRITNVIYTENGIKVEFQTAPNEDAKILVNGEAVNPLNKMLPFDSAVGKVYISHDIPRWPRATRGGNIQIVGSQGLAVAIYALHDYAWFVHIYAMPSMKNKLYGLCDVYTSGKDPVQYMKEDGTPTINIYEFIKSWQVQMS